MAGNDRYLAEAQTLAKECEVQLEPERLREASVALANVGLAQEHDPRTRTQLRMESLLLWLRLLQLLDRSLDPNFNPADVPEKLVEPPPIPGGEILRPGADPSRIADPKARAQYERAIAANRAKNKNYQTQIHLRRLKEQLPSQAESFIRNSYSSAPGDQRELRTAIDQIITDPARKAQLTKLLRPSHSP